MRRGSLTVAGLVAVGVWALGAVPALAAGHASTETVRPTGVVTLRALAAKPVNGAALRSAGQVRVRLADPLDGGGEAPFLSASGFPAPQPFSLLNAASWQGWEGITNLEQENAPGNGGFAIEPPDQGLCVGAYKGQAYVFESVNDALQVYDTKGDQLLAGPVALSSLFGVPPTVDQSGNFGPAVSDPKCWFDPQTHRWFHSAVVYGFDPKTGALRPPSFTALAVSSSGDPLGAYHLYRIPSLDIGQPNCPCLGDQPLLGGDQYGLYISTAEYSMGPAKSNFAEIDAMSKQSLIAGGSLRVVHLRNLTNTGVDGRTTGTVQPAFTDSPNQNITSHDGTEYFLSGFDCVPVSCNIAPGGFNKITAWAMTNTRSLQTARPEVRLSRSNLTVGRYASPPWQFQKTGPTPFGCNPKLGADCHTPPVTANDSRMNQVILSNGRLWSGINTGVSPGKRVGIEYFIVRPKVSAQGAVSGRTKSGYVSATNENVSFPSLGVNRAGRGVIAFSVMGKAYYPSAGYVRVNDDGAHGAIHVVANGFRPEDGFTCYKQPFGYGPPCRWGDYSASVAGPDGRIWSGAEWIGPHARDVYANWSTFIFPVTP